MIVSLLAILFLPAIFFLRAGKGGFEGGWSINALVYALWDPLVAWGVILGMLWAVRIYWPQSTPFTASLSRNAYGAYIIHPPVVVGASLLVATWTLDPLAKFVIVGTAACAGSFFAAALLRGIPGARQIL